MDAALTATTVSEKTPAENGEKAKVPLLSYRQLEQFELFDETPLLDTDWEITDFDTKLLEGDFAHDVEAMRRASLTISQLEKVECDVYDKLDSQLALFDAEKGWSNTELVYWLDRNIPFVYADRDQKVAWINEAVTYLVEARSLSVEELAYRKFRLRGAIERKLADGLVRAKQQVSTDCSATNRVLMSAMNSILSLSKAIMHTIFRTRACSSLRGISFR